MLKRPCPAGGSGGALSAAQRPRDRPAVRSLLSEKRSSATCQQGTWLTGMNPALGVRDMGRLDASTWLLRVQGHASSHRATSGGVVGGIAARCASYLAIDKSTAYSRRHTGSRPLPMNSIDFRPCPVEHRLGAIVSEPRRKSMPNRTSRPDDSPRFPADLPTAEIIETEVQQRIATTLLVVAGVYRGGCSSLSPRSADSDSLELLVQIVGG